MFFKNILVDFQDRFQILFLGERRGGVAAGIRKLSEHLGGRWNKSLISLQIKNCH